MQNVVSQAARNRFTTLTAWFERNKIDQDARQFLYHQFPEHYVWNKKDKQWTPRQRGFGATIGRVYSVSPRENEKYFLRLMLHHINGAQCFEDLRTVDGTAYPTFQAAAGAYGLLESDNLWDNCLRDANHHQSPSTLRSLFVTILIFCEPADPLQLWEEHKSILSEDYIHRIREFLGGAIELNDQQLKAAYGNCLLDIDDLLGAHSRQLSSIPGFNMTLNDTRRENSDIFAGVPRVIVEQRLLCAEASRMPDPNLLPFNLEQRRTFDRVMQATQLLGTGNASSNFDNVYFVDGPGGTGKTFLFNAILDAVRRTDEIALAVASSGTAALLLKGEETAIF